MGKPQEPAAVSSRNLDVAVSSYDGELTCSPTPLLQSLSRVARHFRFLHGLLNGGKYYEFGRQALTNMGNKIGNGPGNPGKNINWLGQADRWLAGKRGGRGAWRRLGISASAGPQ